MNNDDFSSGWDEHQWEQHIDEVERKTNRLKKFIDSSWGNPHDPNWLKFVREYESVEEALNAYLDEELSFDDTFFPDDLNDFDDDDEDDDFDLFNFIDPDLNREDIENEMDELDEDLFGDLEFNDEADFLDDDDVENEDLNREDEYFLVQFDLYEDAREINLYLMFKSQEFPRVLNSSLYKRLVDQTMNMIARLSSATSFNTYDEQHAGAIIAYSKKSLQHANKALRILTELREFAFDDKEYHPLHRKLFEYRNNLALFIQDMRDFLNGWHPPF